MTSHRPSNGWRVLTPRVDWVRNAAPSREARARARRHTATTTIDMSAALTPGAVQKIRDSPSEATNVRVQVRAAR